MAKMTDGETHLIKKVTRLAKEIAALKSELSTLQQAEIERLANPPDEAVEALREAQTLREQLATLEAETVELREAGSKLVSADDMSGFWSDTFWSIGLKQEYRRMIKALDQDTIKALKEQNHG